MQTSLPCQAFRQIGIDKVQERCPNSYHSYLQIHNIKQFSGENPSQIAVKSMKYGSDQKEENIFRTEIMNNEIGYIMQYI